MVCDATGYKELIFLVDSFLADAAIIRARLGVEHADLAQPAFCYSVVLAYLKCCHLRTGIAMYYIKYVLAKHS